MKTKSLLLALALLIGSFVKAQITFEHTYPQLDNESDFNLIEIAANTYKYIYVEYDSSKFTLYNLNHSIYQVVNIPVKFNIDSNQYYVNYITTSLFDCDSTTLEYLIYNPGNPPYFVQILRSDNTVLFSSDSAYGVTNIVNTPVGAKMILDYIDFSHRVFGLCGSLPVTLALRKLGNNNNSALSYPYPNPSINATTINYQLPDGVNQGEIVFYNLNGMEVKNFKVDNTFNTLELNNIDLPAGTYLYNLLTSGNATAAKKMVVIK